RGMLALSSIVNGPDALDVADLNWRRLTPLRQALIQAFAPATGLTQLQRVRITHRPGDSALAWLLAGWLCSRLGWAAAGEWPIQVGEARRGDDILSIVFSTGDRDDLEATMNGHRVLVRYKTRVAP